MKLTAVTLTIKGEDFKNPYVDNTVCPISSALKRAGIQARHCGINLLFGPTGHVAHQSVYTLSTKVFDIYLDASGGNCIDPDSAIYKGITSGLPKDFTYTILVPSEWVSAPVKKNIVKRALEAVAAFFL